MTTNPVIKALEWVLFAGFIIHIVYAAIISIKNKQARPKSYVYKKGNGTGSTWFSRNMGWTGGLFLIFLVVHLVMFWGFYHYGEGQMVNVVDAHQQNWKITGDYSAEGEFGSYAIGHGSYLSKDDVLALQKAGVDEVQGISMTEVVKQSFSNPLIVIFYVLAMVALAAHLAHGFQSAFRTLGLVHKKYTPIITMAGTLIAYVIPAVFAAMPIYYYVTEVIM